MALDDVVSLGAVSQCAQDERALLCWLDQQCRTHAGFRR